ncbi:MAG TPA: hypothetical protein VGZ03_01605 [Acidimicrobiales bacterium]|nr:hypothetical protein [Acidimicrobiales bacterium]
MIILILLGVLVVMAVGAGLAQWRAKSIQSNPNFAPTDHVEVARFGWGRRSRSMPLEHHHDEDPPGFQIGD